MAELLKNKRLTPPKAWLNLLVRRIHRKPHTNVQLQNNEAPQVNKRSKIRITRSTRSSYYSWTAQ